MGRGRKEKGGERSLLTKKSGEKRPCFCNHHHMKGESEILLLGRKKGKKGRRKRPIRLHTEQEGRERKERGRAGFYPVINRWRKQDGNWRGRRRGGA